MARGLWLRPGAPGPMIQSVDLLTQRLPFPPLQPNPANIQQPSQDPIAACLHPWMLHDVYVVDSA